MKSLLKLRKILLHEQNFIVKDYRLSKQIFNICSANFKVYLKRDMDRQKKQYEEIREDILDIEEQIAILDEDLLDDIVEHAPDDIENAINLFTDYEWDHLIK